MIIGDFNLIGGMIIGDCATIGDCNLTGGMIIGDFNLTGGMMIGDCNLTGGMIIGDCARIGRLGEVAARPLWEGVRRVVGAATALIAETTIPRATHETFNHDEVILEFPQC